MDQDARRALVEDLARHPLGATTNAADRAMLGYALKLNATPAAIDVGDIAALRAHGFDDRAIHDICAITAYFAFVNRIADGLGVEVEEDRRTRS